MSDIKVQDMQAATEDKADLIGVDPLAWLSEAEKASLQKDTAVNNSTTDSNDASVSDKTEEVVLQSSLTIRDINELLEMLNGIDKESTAIVFDTEQVERVDAAALQLLVGYYLFAINDGKQVSWKNPSENFINSVTLLGLNQTMQLAA